MSTFLPAYSAFACSQPFQDFSSAALHIVSSMHRACTFWNSLSQPRQPCLPRTRCRMLMARPGLGRSSPPAAPAPLPPGGFVRVPLARFVPWGAGTALPWRGAPLPPLPRRWLGAPSGQLILDGFNSAVLQRKEKLLPQRKSSNSLAFLCVTFTAMDTSRCDVSETRGKTSSVQHQNPITKRCVLLHR